MGTTSWSLKENPQRKSAINTVLEKEDGDEEERKLCYLLEAQMADKKPHGKGLQHAPALSSTK